MNRDILNYSFDAIIEMSQGGLPVKYEIEKEKGKEQNLRVSRVINTSFMLPFNYGYVPNTLAGDGDPIDVLVLTPNIPLHPTSIISVRPLGVLLMEDENGPDVKILAVPCSDVLPYYKDMKHLSDLPQITKDAIEHFFKHYKDLEEKKWSSVKGWQGKLRAIRFVEESIDNFERGK